MSAAPSRRGSQVSDSLHLEQEEGEARLRTASLSDGVIGRTLMIDNPRIRWVQHISTRAVSESSRCFSILDTDRQSSIKARRASSAATSYRRSAVVRYKPAYDATVTPVELRNHNLYIQ